MMVIRLKVQGVMMNKILQILCVLTAMVLLFSACGNPSADNSQGPGIQTEYQIRHITPADARQRLNQEKHTFLIDIGSEEDYIQKHIPKAMSIPGESLGNALPRGLPLFATLILYGRNSEEVQAAARKFWDLGYQSVYELGLLENWSYETAAGPESKPAPLTGEFGSFTALDVNGIQVDQEILRYADLTVINIWGTFCGPCIKEMPDLGELAQTYRDKNVQIIGIVIDVLDPRGNTDPAQVQKANQIIAQTKADYLHLLPSEDLIRLKLNTVSAIPETVFVDRNGKVLDSTMGAMEKSKWISRIDSLLSSLQS